jgi:predicted RNA-binding protein
MKKFRDVFYIPDKKDGIHVDDLIGNYTLFLNRVGSIARFDFERLKVLKKLYSSHVELWTQNDSGMFWLGKSWTSTMGQLGGKDRTGSGVRVAPAYEIYKNPERWFYAEFEVPDKRYIQLMEFLQTAVKENAGYDKALIANFFIPKQIWNFDKGTQYICNELCNDGVLLATRENYDHICTAIRSKLDENYSPILTATTLHYCGVDFYNMDGNLLLAGFNQNQSTNKN